MELEEMKKLESEVKGLHFLMREVHKNQVALSKVLLNRKVIRIGDPELLEEDGIEVDKLESGTALRALQAPKPLLPTKQTEERPAEGRKKEWKTPSTSHDKEEDENLPEGTTSSEIGTSSSGTCRKISRSSCFIRNMLSEDSQAGIAVVDLFVTVKMAKDNLQFLSRSNSEAFDKINRLKTETVAIGQGYKTLLDDMQLLLCRMNESIDNRGNLLAVIHLPGEKPRAKNFEEGENSQWTSLRMEESDFEETRSVGSRNEEPAPDSYGGGCLGCFVSAHKDALFEELPDLTEASLVSFLSTLFWMQKGQQSVCEACKTSLAGHLLEEEAEDSDGILTLSESTFRMFCDICEILDAAAREDLASVGAFDLESTEADDLVRCGSTSCTKSRKEPSLCDKSTSDNQNEKCPTADSLLKCFGCRRKAPRRGRVGKSSRRETASGSESEFEDGTVDSTRPLTLLDLRARPSVTCMGDLTRAVPGKKSASTLTTANNVLSYRKFSNEIRSKIKRIKSKKSLKLDEQKSSKGSKKLLRKVDLKVKGGSEAKVKSKNLCGVGEDYMSEESFYNCDSGSAGTGSVSGEDELEEFVEIFNENSKTRENVSPYETAVIRRHDARVRPECKRPKTLTRAGGNSFLGFLQKTTLKTIKALFFEIQKCYPSNFVQEILPKTAKKSSVETLESGSISLGPGDSKQKQLVIQGSASDFVIYIQVELDEHSGASHDLLMEQKSSPLETQTQGPSSEENCLEEEEDEEQSYDIWEECEVVRPAELEERERITFEEPETVIGHPELLQKWPKVQKDFFRDGKSVSEVTVEKEIQQAHPDDADKAKGREVQLAKARVMVLRDAKQRADVWLLQNGAERAYRSMRSVVTATIEVFERVETNPLELRRALNLVHEIENDVVEVKLGSAISILPRLEWELRKHLQSKMKDLGERGMETRNESLFSSVDLWPEEESSQVQNVDPSERMHNLLLLLSELEVAIKSNEYNGVTLSHYDTSKVYRLLHDLVVSIRGLEGNVSLANLSETLNIASQLDTAVREYDSIIKKRPLDYLSTGSRKRWESQSESLEAVPAKEHLRNVRKKVFEIIEDEAIQVERRIERDLERLSHLERENDEAMTFLEAFLQKTKRRISELTCLKSELRNLSMSIRDMHDSLMDKIILCCQNKEKREADAKAQARTQATAETERAAAEGKEAKVTREAERPAAEAKEESRPSAPKETGLRETVSGLLIALDNLKSRAREKNELCKEILSSNASDRVRETANSSRRSSRSSFTAKHTDNVTSSLKIFRKIGDNRLYVAWSSPEGSLKDFVSGYEIYVNGKLNQKVRNSRRLQAVLYSIDFSKSITFELYAIAENYPKMLMITEHYQEE